MPKRRAYQMAWCQVLAEHEAPTCLALRLVFHRSIFRAAKRPFIRPVGGVVFGLKSSPEGRSLWGCAGWVGFEALRGRSPLRAGGVVWRFVAIQVVPDFQVVNIGRFL
jgi:hypothetical protein